MTRKCGQGKSCGASCIQRSKYCTGRINPTLSRSLKQTATQLKVVGLFEQVKEHKAPKYQARFNQIRKDLGQELGRQIRQQDDVRELKKRLQKEGLLPASTKPSSTPKAQPTSPKKKGGISESSLEEWEGLSARDFDKKLEKEKLEREGNPKFDGWLPKNAEPTVTGKGSFGEVSVTPNGHFIKRGILTESEAKILEKVGKKDLGPGLIAVDLDGRVRTEGSDGPYLDLMAVEHLGLRHGRMAMTRVPGKELDSLASEPEVKIAGIPAADIYWKAMADLHRLGIAHNDAHPMNLFVGEKTGKGRWIDFGLSQESSKAALAEALGAFADRSRFFGRSYQQHMPDDAMGHYQEGNWQTREWVVTGTGRVDMVMAKPGAMKLKEDMPVLAQIRSNRFNVDTILREKHGLNDDEIAAIYAHGIRSPLETYEQGPWAKLSGDDAQKLIETLYKGV